MTVYGKIENNKLVTAYNGYNGVIGLADSVELCLANGFTAYTEEEISGYFTGTYKVIDGVLTNITSTPEYIAEQLTKAKADKLAEIDLKAKDYEQNGTVEYKNCLFEMSDSNRKNLSDTQEALTLQGLTSTQWNSKDDTLVELTIEDIQNIRLNLILGEIQKLWLVKQPYYKNLVEKATTVDEVNAIVIDYSVDVTE